MGALSDCDHRTERTPHSRFACIFYQRNLNQFFQLMMLSQRTHFSQLFMQLKMAMLKRSLVKLITFLVGNFGKSDRWNSFNATLSLCYHFRVGGQEHWYLECQVCCVVPREDKEVTVHVATQHPMLAQVWTDIVVFFLPSDWCTTVLVEGCRHECFWVVHWIMDSLYFILLFFSCNNDTVGFCWWNSPKTKRVLTFHTVVPEEIKLDFPGICH